MGGARRLAQCLCDYTTEYGSPIVPPGGWPAKNYLAMITATDNHGPPSAGEVESLRRQAERKLPGVRIHFGTLDDFARAIEAEKPELPVIRGDTPDTWIHGPMSMPQETKTARNIRPLEPALDSLDTQLRAWGLVPGPLAQSLAEAYENSLLYGEHTWGLNAEFGPRNFYGDAWRHWLAEAEAEKPPADNDYSHVPNGSKKKWLKSYDDHRNYIRKTHEIVTRELRSRLEELAGAVAADGPRIVVYNPLPWPRSGIVAVPQGVGPSSGMKDLAAGKTVAVGQGQFLAEDVPANGYKTFVAANLDRKAGIDQPAGGPNFNTRWFKVAFDLRRGGIASLVEKKAGRELVDQSSPYVLGQFLHERFSTKEVDRFFNSYSRKGWAVTEIGKPGMPGADQSPYLASTPGEWRLSWTHTEVVDTATLAAGDTKGLAKAYSISFTFPRHAAWVEVEWHVTDKTANKIPEGGWLCLPFAVEGPHFTVGRLGGTMDPARDIIPGANRHLMAVASGVAVTSANGYGAAMCPLDSPLVSLGRPGLWEWSLDYVPKTSAVFVNLYNNMWNTNFPLWQDGSWSERVRLWPTAAGADIPEDLAVESWEARLPLLAAAANGPAGKLPISQAGLTLSRRGVLVTAHRRRPRRQRGHAPKALGASRSFRSAPGHVAPGIEGGLGNAGQPPRRENRRADPRRGRRFRVSSFAATPRRVSFCANRTRRAIGDSATVAAGGGGRWARRFTAGRAEAAFRSRTGVLVAAFGPDPDGVNKGSLLRLWDQSGTTAEVAVTLPIGLVDVARGYRGWQGERR